jgi:hypothetical protein
MTEQKKKLIDQIVDFPNSSKYLKIGGIVIGSVIGIYLMGHLFKISAHCVRGYKEFKSALKNG